MKEILNVALVQMPVEWLDYRANLAYIRAAIVRAKKEQNVDLVVFPELCSIGYIRERNKQFGCEYIKCAEKIPGPFVTGIAEQARESGCYVITGMTELHPDIPGTLYNAAVFIGPKGELIGRHRKVHIPGYEKHYFVPASNAEVFSSELGNIGITICYDGQFPEITRVLALKGAELLVMLWNMPDFSNPPELLYYLTAARAAENRMFAVSCNRIGKNGDISFFGHSVVSDPIGNFLAKAQREEVILYAALKRDLLLEERAQQPVFRDRRPDMYAELVRPL
jgi:predicted amidohydrolase